MDELVARIHELYWYDADAGQVISKRTKERVGSFTRWGYLSMTIWIGERAKNVLAHRAAWLLVYGSWPAGVIDHINGVKTDNRIGNLRIATAAINTQNERRARSSNKSGFLGVRQMASGRFGASIESEGRQLWIGTFETAEQAHAAYVQVKRRIHPGCTL